MSFRPFPSSFSLADPFPDLLVLLEMIQRPVEEWLPILIGFPVAALAFGASEGAPTSPLFPGKLDSQLFFFLSLPKSRMGPFSPPAPWSPLPAVRAPPSGGGSLWISLHVFFRFLPRSDFFCVLITPVRPRMCPKSAVSVRTRSPFLAHSGKGFLLQRPFSLGIHYYSLLLRQLVIQTAVPFLCF